MSQTAALAQVLDELPTRHPDADPLNTVLIVEDSMVERVRLQAMLKKFGYRVVTADNGSQALEILARERILLVISDWRMPEMTGIELCSHLRASPEYDQPYVVLVTGHNTKSDLVAGMDAGADDFITKPFNSEELRVRLQAGARLLRLRAEAAQRNTELAQTYAMIRKDLDAAARMQRELLPANISPFQQIEVASLFMPATVVAGDSFNFFPLDEEHLAFYQIDVSGHGIASAMLSFTVSRFLSPQLGAIMLRRKPGSQHNTGHRGLPEHILPPHKVVASLNRRFLEKKDCTHYFSMVYGVLNINTGLGALCQAGHPHPLISNKQGKLRQVGKGGFPVGMLEQADFNSVAFQLAEGERLFLYSDGVTDCNSEDGTVFSRQRLATLLKYTKDHSLSQGIDFLGKQLQRWNGTSALDDDISLLAIGRLANR